MRKTKNISMNKQNPLHARLGSAGVDIIVV